MHETLQREIGHKFVRIRQKMVITGLTIILSIVTVKTSKTLQLVFSFVKGSTAASNFATTACFFFFFPPLDDLEKVSIGAWKRHFMLLCNYYRLADQPTDRQTDMGVEKEVTLQILRLKNWARCVQKLAKMFKLVCDFLISCWLVWPHNRKDSTRKNRCKAGSLHTILKLNENKCYNFSPELIKIERSVDADNAESVTDLDCEMDGLQYRNAPHLKIRRRSAGHIV